MKEEKRNAEKEKLVGKMEITRSITLLDTSLLCFSLALCFLIL